MDAATSVLCLCDAPWFASTLGLASTFGLHAVMARMRTRVRLEDRREVAFPPTAELDCPSVMLERARRVGVSVSVSVVVHRGVA